MRVYFKHVQWPRLLLNKMSWGTLTKQGMGRKFFTLVLPALTAPVYAALFWRPLKRRLINLPAASLRGTTYKLMDVLKSQTGNRIEVIDPMPVPPSTVVSLGVKLPAIVDSFGGQDGGFILYSS
ncbi:hypothetical protein D3C84_692880 [compost metagenome]